MAKNECKMEIESIKGYGKVRYHVRRLLRLRQQPHCNVAPFSSICCVFLAFAFSVKSSRSELAKSYWTRFETGTLLHLVSTRPIGKGLPCKIRRETSESREINAKHQFTHQFPILFFHVLSNINLDNALQRAWWISLCWTGPFSQPQKAPLEPLQ